jgi:hypothetical protein
MPVECRHIVTCKVCRRENVDYHEAAVSIRSWADAIADLAFRVQGEETIDAATPLLGAIGGLAWVISFRVGADIESETFSTRERGPKPVPKTEPVPAPSLGAV